MFVAFSPAVPVGGGMFVAFSPGASPTELTIPPELSEFPAELVKLSINETVPNLIESSITAPSPLASESSQSVPEPSTVLLLSAALSLLAIIRLRLGLLR
jgi:hypothetical protein